MRDERVERAGFNGPALSPPDQQPLRGRPLKKKVRISGVVGNIRLPETHRTEKNLALGRLPTPLEALEPPWYASII
jgi:hypothetical protein